MLSKLKSMPKKKKPAPKPPPVGAILLKDAKREQLHDLSRTLGLPDGLYQQATKVKSLKYINDPTIELTKTTLTERQYAKDFPGNKTQIRSKNIKKLKALGITVERTASAYSTHLQLQELKTGVKNTTAKTGRTKVNRKLEYLIKTEKISPTTIVTKITDTNSVRKVFQLLGARGKLYTFDIEFTDFRFTKDGKAYPGLRFKNIQSVQQLMTALAQLEESKDSYSAVIDKLDNTVDFNRFNNFDQGITHIPMNKKDSKTMFANLMGNPIEITFRRRAGGCNDHATKAGHVIGTGIFEKLNSRTGYNNCGLVCILHITGIPKPNVQMCTDLRRRYGITTNKTMVSFEKLNEICDGELNKTETMCRMFDLSIIKGEYVYKDLEGIHYSESDIVGMKCRKIILFDNHYVVHTKCKNGMKPVFYTKTAGQVIPPGIIFKDCIPMKVKGKKDKVDVPIIERICTSCKVDFQGVQDLCNDCARKTVFKTCARCYKRYKKDGHTCSSSNINYAQRKGTDAGTIFFDLETVQDGGLESKDMCDEFGVWTTIWRHTATLTAAYSEKIGRKHWFGADSVDRFIEWLYTEAEAGRFYQCGAHNLAKFDGFFLLNSIWNGPYKDEYNHARAIYKGNSVMKFNFLGHTFFDTNQHMTSSLASLCQEYKVADPKLTYVEGPLTLNDPTIPRPLLRSQVYHTMDDICIYKPDESMSAQDWCIWMQKPENKFRLDIYIEYCEVDCVALSQVWTGYEQGMSKIIKDLRIGDDMRAVASYTTLPGLAKAIWSASCKQSGVDKMTSVLTGEDWDLIRSSVVGGMSHVNHYGTFIDQEVIAIDIVSLYPTQMIHQMYPCGDVIQTPEFVPGKMGVYRLTDVTFTKDHKPHCFPRRAAGETHDWANKFVGETTATTVDMENITAEGGHFKCHGGIYWTDTYNPFDCVRSFMDIKDQQDKYKNTGDKKYNGAVRAAAKLLANSLSGKLGEKRYVGDVKDVRQCKDRELTDGSVKIVKMKNGQTLAKKQKATATLSPVHLNAFILAYSRRDLFAYMDQLEGGRLNMICGETDSLYLMRRHLGNLKQKVGTNHSTYDTGFYNTLVYDAKSKQLGNMTFDFEWAGHLGRNLVSQKFIVIGKKCYFGGCMVDISEVDENGNYKALSYHKFAAKGQAAKSITMEAFEAAARGECLLLARLEFMRELFAHNGPSIFVNASSTRKFRITGPLADKGALPVYEGDCTLTL
jgi:hypothetical protein